LSRIDQSWRDFLDAVAAIPVERLGEPGVVGQWSIKDLFGHIAFWDSYAVEASRRLVAGEPAAEIDWETMNQREAAARAQRTPDELRAEMDRCHDELLGFIRTLRPTDLMIPAVEFRIRVDSFDHYADHANEVRAWREREAI
jgi:hypothetical protein